MLEALRQILSSVSKFFLGVFGKSPQSVETPPVSPPQPPPVLTPVQPPQPKPQPGPMPEPTSTHGPQSPWWDGRFVMTQDYGCTDLTVEGFSSRHPECPYFHEGIDFALPCNTPLYAALEMQVVEVDPPGYGGGAIRMADYHHRDARNSSLYDIWFYHLNSYSVVKGQWLAPGDLIGYSGSRGYATGCHLHFEVRPSGGAYRSSINPTNFLYLT